MQVPGAQAAGALFFLFLSARYKSDNYIDHNSTHYLNVNQAMLEHKLLEINDQENDFNPNNWTYYVKKQDIPEFPTWTAIALFMVLTTTAMILRTKNQKHMKNVSSKY